MPIPINPNELLHPKELEWLQSVGVEGVMLTLPCEGHGCQMELNGDTGVVIHRAIDTLPTEVPELLLATARRQIRHVLDELILAYALHLSE